MRLLFILFFFPAIGFAEVRSFDSKSGFVFGFGAAMTSYKLPVNYSGGTKNKIDDSSTLIGPLANVGYDVMFKKFLVGVRAEGYMADTLGMGNSDDETFEDRTSGKVSGLNATGRFGVPYYIRMNDFLDQKVRMIGEFFLEAGVGQLWADLSKNYQHKKNSDSYKLNLDDERTTGILAVGANIATRAGGFFELKLMQTRTISNAANLKGSSQVSGGTLENFDEKKKDFNRGAVSTLMISFGHHY